MGKSSSQTIGYHYRLAFQVVITFQIDAFLEFQAAEKTAWDGGAQQWFTGGKAVRKRGSGMPINSETEPATGPITASGRINIGAPNLFGGVKDQGGIVGPVDIMFGEADQVPNPYLQGVFGNQVAAWRGFTTLVFAGGQYGAMNPMPQKPAYKVRKIIEGWDAPGCWYPEKAEIFFGPTIVISVISEGDSSKWLYLNGEGVGDYSDPSFDDSAWDSGVGGFGNAEHPDAAAYGFSAPNTIIPPVNLGDPYKTLWVRRSFSLDRATHVTLKVLHDNDLQMWLDGEPIAITPLDDFYSEVSMTIPSGDHLLALQVVDTGPPGSGNYVACNFRAEGLTGNHFAMNPAHTLYYVRTGSDKGLELRANINETSLIAAADRLFAESFGLCWKYDPSRDTPDSFEQRICRIIGGSFERSLTDGQWYLDLARGDYDIDSLPIIGDDDILEFRELPTTLDRAVNSVAVRYFDVARKESVITPAVRALGLIRRFGEIHETLDFPEIPTGSLALRVADREARAYVTPTRAFELVTTPRLKALRRNQYARLQSPKRGIADMVVIIGSKEHGTLKSGAIRWKVSQDIYALPDTSYIEIEEGVDTSPPTVPVPIEHARAFEAPYIDLVATLPASELAALEPDTGFLLAVAADPGAGLSYSMAVQPSGGDYMLGGNGEWCPSTTTAGAHPLEIGPTIVPLASVGGLPEIALGSLVLWDDEWCRLDAIDYDTAVATLGRGCADTVPQAHAAGSRLWFYVEAAYATTEFTDGETVNVKLLPATGNAQLPLDAATAIPLEFDARQARPYPPAGLLINGEEAPDTVVGEITLTWVHRDRVLQADQAIDQAQAGIGPEPGTTYTARWYLNAALAHTESGITGTTASYTPAAAGLLRIELEAVRDGLASWQMHVREFPVGGALQAEDGTLITTEAGQPILME